MYQYDIVIKWSNIKTLHRSTLQPHSHQWTRKNCLWYTWVNKLSIYLYLYRSCLYSIKCSYKSHKISKVDRWQTFEVERKKCDMWGHLLTCTPTWRGQCSKTSILFEIIVSNNFIDVEHTYIYICQRSCCLHWFIGLSQTDLCHKKLLIENWTYSWYAKSKSNFFVLVILRD